MRELRSVLFDMDGVLYDYDFEARLKLLEDALDVPAETIRENIFRSGFEDVHDEGRLTTEEYIAGISARLGVEVTRRQWLAARKWAMAPKPDMLELARTLAAKVEIALLTNNGSFLAEGISELAPELPEIFGERLFVSGVVGLSKDYASTFSDLLNRLGWDPATTLFVDDSPDYIAQADKAGLVTHRFEEIGGLKGVLEEAALI